MKLGKQVGLGPGHIVLDGDLAPPPKRGVEPQILAYVYCGQMTGSIKMPLGIMEVGLDPGHIVTWGSSSPKRGTAPPDFRPMCIVAKRSPISATAEHL